MARLMVRHQYAANLLDMIPVSRIMSKAPVSVPGEMPVEELTARRRDPSRPESKFRSFAVKDASGRMVGVVTRSDLGKGREDPRRRRIIDVATPRPVTVGPDQRCSAALEAMVMRDVGHLPVVNDSGHLVGYLSRGDLLRAWRTRIEEEREIVFGLRRRVASRPIGEPGSSKS